ncbi:MAG: hypothetical protein SO206_05065 [Bacilli bacterium]|nr:hypothetical protein [Bacilli bacterium]
MSNLVLDGRNVKWGYVPAYKPTSVRLKYFKPDHLLRSTPVTVKDIYGNTKAIYGLVGTNPTYFSTISQETTNGTINYTTEWYGCWRS